MEDHYQRCGKHHYFVSEVIGVEAEGMVYILIVCTDCGESQAKAHKVSAPEKRIRLLLEEKKGNKDGSI